jgi:hypothetical protein
MQMPDSVRKAMWARLKKDWDIPENQFSINGIAVDPRTKPTEEDIADFANDRATKYLQRLSNDQLENVANHYELRVGDRWGKEGSGKFGSDSMGENRTREDLEDELKDIAIDEIGSTLNEIYGKKR